ncbi:MAG TPA: hypothetical protein VF173_07315 [Thermoanaerobaculia bacterium]|nr:hypothetical protein [Thermoanaerobaculia bacterium]
MRSLETPVFAHWHKFVPEFQTSPQEFYAALEAAVAKREIPELTTSRIEYHESGVISALRIYLRVQRKKLAFDVCAAPFGTGFFFSSWLTEPKKSYKAWGCAWVLFLLIVAWLILVNFGYQGCGIALLLGLASVCITALGVWQGWFLSDDIILDLPYIGALYAYLFDPETYYKEDTRIVYQEIVHGAVLEVVNETLVAKGLRSLAPEDTKASTRSFVR